MSAWYCQPPAGPEIRSIEAPGGCNVVIGDGTVVELCLGLRYLASGDVVPTDPALAQRVLAVHYAADGSAWASIIPVGAPPAPPGMEEKQLVRVTADGAQVVRSLDGNPQFAVDEQVLIVDKGSAGTWREPRP